MKEELNFTNIGNKESQKELIKEIMDLDAKDGLYEDVKPKIDIQPMTQEEMDEIRNPAYKYFDIDDTVNDVEKLAKERTDAFVKMYNTHLEIRQYAFAKGFIEGYNKAKEETESIFANILDHLCDKMESISQEQIDKDNFQLARYRTFKYIFEYIQSLNKQPIKAKETLYTEEQVREAMSMARKLSGVAYTNDEIIQSLKQPKKD